MLHNHRILLWGPMIPYTLFASIGWKTQPLASLPLQGGAATDAHNHVKHSNRVPYVDVYVSQRSIFKFQQFACYLDSLFFFRKPLEKKTCPKPLCIVKVFSYF